MFPERKKNEFGGDMAVFVTQCYVLNIDRGTSLERPNRATVKHSDSEVRQISIQQNILYIVGTQ